MNRSTLKSLAVGTGLASVLVACSHSTPGTLPVVPATRSVGLASALQQTQAGFQPAPANIANAVYVAAYFGNTPIFAYDYSTTQKNLPPICDVPGSYVVNVATDTRGDLIDPDGGSRTVTIFRGPSPCGNKAGSFADNAGQPSDAASWNALTGKIYVANIQATGHANGSVSVCTLAAGCTAVLTSHAISGQLFGIAEDKAGNVFASGYTTAQNTGASLVYWKAGAGNPIRLSAYKNITPGGLTMDPSGNLLSPDTFNRKLWVYSGCPFKCVAHGPFALKGQSVYGRVNSTGTTFEAADFEYGRVDVYAYLGTSGIRYRYSFSAGLDPGADVEGIAIDPGVAP